MEETAWEQIMLFEKHADGFSYLRVRGPPDGHLHYCNDSLPRQEIQKTTKQKLGSKSQHRSADMLV